MWEDLPLWRSSLCAVQVSRFKRLPAMEKPLSRIGSEKKGLNKIQIYLRDTRLACRAGLRCIYKAALALYVFLRKPQKTTIHNSLRSVKQTAVWRLKPFPLRSKVIRLQPAMPLLSPQGKNDRLRYRSAEWTVSTPWSARFQLRWHLRLRLGNVSKLPFLSACT